LLLPSYAVWRHGSWNKREVEFANWIMFMVILNNVEIVQDVRKNC
jgi:cell division FtsZ-interacting protein ZapD